MSLHRRLGRKGTILVILGAMWALQGWAIFTSAVLVPEDTQGLFHLALPVPVRVSLWAVCGVGAMVCAFWQPPRFQAAGYAALVLPAAERCLSYLIGWGISVFTDGGYEDGWSAAAIWLAVVTILEVVAGWPEAPGHGDGT